MLPYTATRTWKTRILHIIFNMFTISFGQISPKLPNLTVSFLMKVHYRVGWIQYSLTTTKLFCFFCYFFVYFKKYFLFLTYSFLSVHFFFYTTTLILSNIVLRGEIFFLKIKVVVLKYVVIKTMEVKKYKKIILITSRCKINERFMND